ncbi:MerR family transcriptional regulator [Liquorilactobacillus aquaticus DSM 21051]|uniref:MerR family transcriptional regulator n=1 Tax=Liquorilactobacillus aquaticus DSM 21051 TaxID=1423725 RepID=A0A0R2CYV6_9LACO|nr:MerR family transcriptional regulator [Liquorilactobacillus aquaticus]KRM96961.1 MerR family transcriptional regulator [Liquorilactobacillus aquaticus DSM 21051]
MIGKKLSLKADVIVGIGDLSKMTGVSTRQLRYWEEKGYIQAVPSKKNTTRKYKFEMSYKVQAIKRYLDQGYTLAKSVEQAEELRKKFEIWKKFIMDKVEKVEIVDAENDYGIIDLGDLEGDQNKRVYGVVDENGCHFEVRRQPDMDK